MAITYVYIASTVLSSTTPTITFNNLPSTFTDFIIKGAARTTTADYYNSTPFFIQNNIGAGLYSTEAFRNTTGVTQSSIYSFANWANGNTSLANAFSYYEIYLSNTNNSTQKQIFAISKLVNSNTTTTDFAMTAAGVNINITSAVSRFDIQNSDSFAIGTSFYVYGIKRD